MVSAKLVVILLFCCSCFIGYSQVESVNQYWTSYSQAIDVPEYLRHKSIKYSGYIRSKVKSEDAKAALWLRVDVESFFHNDIINEDIHIADKWQKFEIYGKTDSSSIKIYLGFYAQNNGEFYFDNVMLSYQDDDGKWNVLPVDNPGFENPINQDNWNEGIRVESKWKSEKFKISYTDEMPYEGKYCVKVKGENIIGNNDTGKYVDVNNVNLYYEIYGEGEPLLMIHGNSQSIGAFLNQVDEFSKYYKVILVDSRGRGNSSYDHNVELTYALQVEDMIEFVDYLELDKVHVLGWSDGGIIGLMMAIQYPERISNLIAMAANIFPEGVKKTSLDRIKTYKQSIEDQDGSSIVLDLLNMLLKYPQLEFSDLQRIESKTLIVAGDHDEIRNEHTVRIFENISNAQLAIMPNETHYLPAENPTLFNEVVLKFMGKK